MSQPEEQQEDVSERTIDYVTDILSQDVVKAMNRIAADLSQSDENGKYVYDETNARDLVRTLFAYLEGTSFIVRTRSALILLEEGKFNDYERAIFVEQTIALRDGEVVLTPARISFQENMKYTFKLADRAHKKATPTLDISKKWWFDFKRMVGVRDRLTHPKLPEDLDVSLQEVELAISVGNGFADLIDSYDWISHIDSC